MSGTGGEPPGARRPPDDYAAGEEPAEADTSAGELEVTLVDDEPVLPEPHTEVQTEEYDDEQGRHVVVTTTLRTTYERADDDEDGNVVILERVNRQVRRTVYVDGEEQEEDEDEGGVRTGGGPDVEYVSEDFVLPEPTETVTETEYEDELGRRVVMRTTLKITYEETTDEEGNIVILEKRQRRIRRTIYEGDEVVEEEEDDDEGRSLPEAQVGEELELPPPTERVEVEEIVDELGRRVEVRTVYSTTYEQATDEDGTVTLLEKVDKRIFRTILDDIPVVQQNTELERPPHADPSVSTQHLPETFELPPTQVVEEINESFDDQGRRVVLKITTTTSYELHDDPSALTILELVVRRVTRTVYVDNEVVEYVEEEPSEPIRRAVPAVTGGPTKDSTPELGAPSTEEGLDERLPETTEESSETTGKPSEPVESLPASAVPADVTEELTPTDSRLDDLPPLGRPESPTDSSLALQRLVTWQTPVTKDSAVTPARSAASTGTDEVRVPDSTEAWPTLEQPSPSAAAVTGPAQAAVSPAELMAHTAETATPVDNGGLPSLDDLVQTSALPPSGPAESQTPLTTAEELPSVSELARTAEEERTGCDLALQRLVGWPETAVDGADAGADAAPHATSITSSPAEHAVLERDVQWPRSERSPPKEDVLPTTAAAPASVAEMMSHQWTESGPNDATGLPSLSELGQMPVQERGPFNDGSSNVSELPPSVPATDEHLPSLSDLALASAAREGDSDLALQRLVDWPPPFPAEESTEEHPAASASMSAAEPALIVPEWGASWPRLEPSPPAEGVRQPDTDVMTPAELMAHQWSEVNEPGDTGLPGLDELTPAAGETYPQQTQDPCPERVPSLSELAAARVTTDTSLVLQRLVGWAETASGEENAPTTAPGVVEHTVQERDVTWPQAERSPPAQGITQADMSPAELMAHQLGEPDGLNTSGLPDLDELTAVSAPEDRPCPERLPSLSELAAAQVTTDTSLVLQKLVGWGPSQSGEGDVHSSLTDAVSPTALEHSLQERDIAWPRAERSPPSQGVTQADITPAELMIQQGGEAGAHVASGLPDLDELTPVSAPEDRPRPERLPSLSELAAAQVTTDTSLVLQKLVGWAEPQSGEWNASSAVPNSAEHVIQERDMTWPRAEGSPPAQDIAQRAALTPAELMMRERDEGARDDTSNLPSLDELATPQIKVPSDPATASDSDLKPTPASAGDQSTDQHPEATDQPAIGDAKVPEETRDIAQEKDAAQRSESKQKPKGKKKRKRGKNAAKDQPSESGVPSDTVATPGDKSIPTDERSSISDIAAEPTASDTSRVTPEFHTVDETQPTTTSDMSDPVYRVTTEVTRLSPDRSPPPDDSDSVERYTDAQGRRVLTRRTVHTQRDTEPDGSCVQRQVTRVVRTVRLDGQEESLGEEEVSAEVGQREGVGDVRQEVEDEDVMPEAVEWPASSLESSSGEPPPEVQSEGDFPLGEQPVSEQQETEGTPPAEQELGVSAMDDQVPREVSLHEPVVEEASTKLKDSTEPKPDADSLPTDGTVSTDHTPDNSGKKKKKKQKKNKKSPNAQTLASRLPNYAVDSNGVAQGKEATGESQSVSETDNKQKEQTSPSTIVADVAPELPTGDESTAEIPTAGNGNSLVDDGRPVAADSQVIIAKEDADGRESADVLNIDGTPSGYTTEKTDSSNQPIQEKAALTETPDAKPSKKGKKKKKKKSPSKSEQASGAATIASHPKDEPPSEVSKEPGVKIEDKPTESVPPASPETPTTVIAPTNTAHEAPPNTEDPAADALPADTSHTEPDSPRACTPEPREGVSLPALPPATPLKTEKQALEESVELVDGELLQEPTVNIVVEDSVDELGRPVKLRRIFVTFIEEVFDEFEVKRTVKRVVRSAQKTTEVDGTLIVEDIDEPFRHPSNEELEMQVLEECIPYRLLGSLLEAPLVEISAEETTDERGRPVIVQYITITIIEEIVDESDTKTTVKRIIRKRRKITDMRGTSILEESEDPEEQEVLPNSVPEATETSVLEDSMVTVTGELVGDPEVSTTIEETVDEHGRPVRIKRVYVTISEEVLDSTGVQRLVKRIVKKTQKTTMINDRPVTADIYELIEEPPMEEQEERVLEMCLPLIEGTLLKTPKVESSYEETVDKDGKHVTIIRFCVTVIEELVNSYGTNTIYKRLIKRIRRVTELDGSSVVEECDEPDEVSELAMTVPEVTEEMAIRECLPLLHGEPLVEPQAELDVVEGVDEQGLPVTTRRLHVSLLEETLDDEGAQRLVRLVVKKTQRTREVDGIRVTENVVEPIVDPSREELEEEAIQQCFPVTCVDSPIVETQTEDVQSRINTPATLNTFVVSATQRDVDELGRVALLKRIITKHRQVYRFQDKTVIEEYDGPERFEVISESGEELDAPIKAVVEPEDVSEASAVPLGAPDARSTPDAELEETPAPEEQLPADQAGSRLVKRVVETARDIVETDEQWKMEHVERVKQGPEDAEASSQPEETPTEAKEAEEAYPQRAERVETPTDSEDKKTPAPENGNAPSQAGNTSAQVDKAEVVLTQAEEVDEAPTHAEHAPVQTGEAPAKAEEAPLRLEEAEVPTEETYTPTEPAPSAEELRDAAVRECLAQLDGTPLGEPEVRAELEQVEDEMHGPVTVHRITVTAREQAPEEDGSVVIRETVFTKIVRVVLVDGRPTVEEYTEPMKTVTLAVSVPELTEQKLLAEALPLARGRLVGDPSTDTIISETRDGDGNAVTLKTVYVTTEETVTDADGAESRLRRTVKKSQRVAEVCGRLVFSDVLEYDPDMVPSAADLAPPLDGVMLGEPSVASEAEEEVNEDGRLVTTSRQTVTVLEQVTDPAGTVTVYERVFTKVLRSYMVNGMLVTEVTSLPVKSRVLSTSVPEITRETAIEDAMTMMTGSLCRDPTVDVSDSEVVLDGETVIVRRTTVTLTERVTDVAGVRREVTRTVTRCQRLRSVPGGWVVQTVRPEPGQEPSDAALKESAAAMCRTAARGLMVETLSDGTVRDEVRDSAGRPVVSRRACVSLLERRTGGVLVRWTGAVLRRVSAADDRLVVEIWPETPTSSVLPTPVTTAETATEPEKVETPAATTPASNTAGKKKKKKPKKTKNLAPTGQPTEKLDSGTSETDSKIPLSPQQQLSPAEPTPPTDTTPTKLPETTTIAATTPQLPAAPEVCPTTPTDEVLLPELDGCVAAALAELRAAALEEPSLHWEHVGRPSRPAPSCRADRLGPHSGPVRAAGGDAAPCGPVGTGGRRRGTSTATGGGGTARRRGTVAAR